MPHRHILMRILLILATLVLGAASRAADRPNILWITVEDISPDLGCYGVAHASTPILDRFAAQGVLYRNAFATIGVCAPARSTIITGMYPPSIGTHHMRCRGTLPDYIRCFPEYLQDAGYYCTNNSKEDYNFARPATTWHESSRNAHYRRRDPGKPFFAVFNITTSHESQVWDENAAKHRAQLPPSQHHDPQTIPVPPFHPDTPRVRRDWANYHDNISRMDQQVGDLLNELKDMGLADDTIVFFYSDHGAGMPRCKRWLYDSSLRVPLIIRFPPKYQHLAPSAPGTQTDRLVSFVDLAPTVLSLAGVDIPQHMQGRAFVGSQQGPPRKYIYGFRDRMDERYDMVRAVGDGRFKYLRNYYPHRPYFHGNYLGYANRMPTLRLWQQMSRDGSLTGPPTQWMGAEKPSEELYDTHTDPHETRNLARSPQHTDKLQELRSAHAEWARRIRDLGFMPEAEMRMGAGNMSEYAWVHRGDDAYNIERVQLVASYATQGRTAAEPLLNALAEGDASIRYWAAIGLANCGEQDTQAVVKQLIATSQQDPSFNVRVAAAESLARMGHDAQALPAIAAGLEHENEWVRLAAANLADDLDDRAASLRSLVEQRAKKKDGWYTPAVLNHILEELNQ